MAKCDNCGKGNAVKRGEITGGKTLCDACHTAALLKALAAIAAIIIIIAIVSLNFKSSPTKSESKSLFNSFIQATK